MIIMRWNILWLFAAVLLQLRFRSSRSTLAELQSHAECPLQPCMWLPENKTFSCPKAGCWTFPSGIASEAREVFLNENNITIVEALPNRYSNLEVIDFANNHISEIKLNAFFYLDNLDTLDLYGNNLNAIDPRALRNTNLRTLFLNDNQITKVEDNSFDFDLPSLERLDLSDNRIVELAMNAVSDMRYLQYLHMQRNDLSRLLPGHFMGLRNLMQLELQGNRIEKLQNNTFNGLFSLETLDLSDNFLTEIEDGAFAHLKRLRQLDLSDNRLTNMHGEVWNGLSSLHTIIMNGNPIKILNPGTFPTHISEIYLRDMHIMEKIPDFSFYGLTNLATIHINYCPALREISPLAFGGIHSTNSRLKHVDFSANRLESLDEHLIEWHSLEELNLSGNRWRCDCYLQWMWLYELPQNASDRMVCYSPGFVAGHRVSSIPYDDFVCGSWPSHHRAMIIVTSFFLVAFVFLLTFICMRYRKRIKLRTFKKSKLKQGNKYAALYNNNEEFSEGEEEGEDSIYTRGEHRKSIVISRIVENPEDKPGMPPPVNV